MALVFLVKNLRVVALITLSTASLVLAPSAEIGGSLIDCCGEPKPFFFLFCFLVFENFVCCDLFGDLTTQMYADFNSNFCLVFVILQAVGDETTNRYTLRRRHGWIYGNKSINQSVNNEIGTDITVYEEVSNYFHSNTRQQNTQKRAHGFKYMEIQVKG